MKIYKKLILLAPVFLLTLTSCRENVGQMKQMGHTKIDQSSHATFTELLGKTDIKTTFGELKSKRVDDKNEEGDIVVAASVKISSKSSFNDPNTGVNYKQENEVYKEVNGEIARVSTTATTTSSLIETKGVIVKEDTYYDTSLDDALQMYATVSVDDHVNYKISKRYINEKIDSEAIPQAKIYHDLFSQNYINIVDSFYQTIDIAMTNIDSAAEGEFKGVDITKIDYIDKKDKIISYGGFELSFNSVIEEFKFLDKTFTNVAINRRFTLLLDSEGHARKFATIVTHEGTDFTYEDCIATSILPIEDFDVKLPSKRRYQTAKMQDYIDDFATPATLIKSKA